jgi:hypothetical protein
MYAVNTRVLYAVFLIVVAASFCLTDGSIIEQKTYKTNNKGKGSNVSENPRMDFIRVDDYWWHSLSGYRTIAVEPIIYTDKWLYSV